jgi:hypothetical protein
MIKDILAFVTRRSSANEVSTTIKFAAPKKNAKVSMVEPVIGTAKNIPSGYTMFIVVISNNIYHPQGYPIDIAEDGSFSTKAYIGTENDAGMKFELLAVVADLWAAEEINRYLERANKRNIYPGMPMLPKGTTVCARVKVVRD